MSQRMTVGGWRLTAATASLVLGVAALAPAQFPGESGSGTEALTGVHRKVMKTDAEWRQALTPAQYAVTRLGATEPAFSGRYAHGHFKGIFACVGCGAPLFDARTKFESGTGWPSFYRPVASNAVETAPDYSAGEPRVEVLCRACGAHLGHVFGDGPAPTGLRFCMNSLALRLTPYPEDEAAAAETGSSKARGKTVRTRGRTRSKSSTTKPDASTAPASARQPSTTGGR